MATDWNKCERCGGKADPHTCMMCEKNHWHGHSHVADGAWGPRPLCNSCFSEIKQDFAYELCECGHARMYHPGRWERDATCDGKDCNGCERFRLGA